MPAMYYCINHEFCNGCADGADRLCSPCRIVAESAKRGKKIEREYRRLTTKPRKPDVFGELEKGRK